MGEIVKLRQARKHRERDEKERLAEQNRLKHGRTRSEKLNAAGEHQRFDRRLDGHRRDRPDQEPNGE